MAAARQWAKDFEEILFTKPIPPEAIDSTWSFLDLVTLSNSYNVKIPAVVCFLESRMIEQVMGELGVDG